MTNEENQALIKWLEEGIACSEEYGFNGNILKSMQFALAALTAPAISLAELVPDELTPKQASRSYGGEVVGYRDGFNACVASILRNIEEAK